MTSPDNEGSSRLPDPLIARTNMPRFVRPSAACGGPKLARRKSEDAQSLAFEATGHPVIDRPSPEADVHEVLDQVRRRQVILDHRFGCQREQSGVLRSSQKQSSVWNLHDVVASSASRTLGSRCARPSAE